MLSRKIAVNIKNGPCKYIETKDNKLVFSNDVELGLSKESGRDCDFSNPPENFKNMKFYKFILESIGHGLLINSIYFPYQKQACIEGESRVVDLHVSGREVDAVKDVEDETRPETSEHIDHTNDNADESRSEIIGESVAFSMTISDEDFIEDEEEDLGVMY